MECALFMLSKFDVTAKVWNNIIECSCMLYNFVRIQEGRSQPYTLEYIRYCCLYSSRYFSSVTFWPTVWWALDNRAIGDIMRAF
jgi:hypothetical protein